MIENKNIQLAGENNRPILLDYIHAGTDDKNLPIIIFCHGFKGFKDWGAWDLMSSAFAKAGFLFIKFNYSHNGGTAEQPIDFPDLEAFGNNNYSIEVRDTERVIDWVASSNLPVDIENINLMGHSRAGGIVTIVGQQDTRIHRVISLAGVSDYAARFPKDEALKQWKKDGVHFIENGRTKQQMPLYYQFYKDFVAHEEELDIMAHAALLDKPHLIIHGDNDPAVNVEEARQLHRANPASQLKIIERADHVFGASHPWESQELPKDMVEIVGHILSFIENN
jgi:pimeloyl-ACP methyl ester carboxylesterase